MQSLKICFIGVGSIAKRHIRNLRKICVDRKIEIVIEAYRHNSDISPVEEIGKIYNSITEVPDDYDIIFITNPTALHLDSLKEFHNKGKNFFIEKPVVSLNQIDEAKKFKLRDEAVYYVACPLRYSTVIQYVKENVPIDSIISVRCISSSYLPSWRPGQDYRKTYSAQKDLGGGVSIDLIHEWDYLVYLFGQPDRIHSFIGKKSDLDIDSDDYAIYIAELKDKIIELHLDYFGRNTIREICLFTKEDTIVGDIENHYIKFLSSGKVIDLHEERDDYQRKELNYFLDMIFGLEKREDNYHLGIDILGLTQGRVKYDHDKK